MPQGSQVSTNARDPRTRGPFQQLLAGGRQNLMLEFWGPYRHAVMALKLLLRNSRMYTSIP
jgi:hypothetical protein